MNICGKNFNLEEAAQNIALLYTQKLLDSGEAYDEKEVDNLLQIYINTFVYVASKDAEELKALIR